MWDKCRAKAPRYGASANGKIVAKKNETEEY